MNNITTKETSDWILKYNDDAHTHKKAYDALLAFYMKHDSYSGESIQQSDSPIIDAPNLLSDIADDIFCFERTWKE